MKYAFASALAALMIVGAAVAQTTPPTPAAPAVPVAVAPPSPSACPAYPAAPTVPAADAIRNERDLNAGTLLVNAYLQSYQTVHNCRVAEIQTLKVQSDARVAEAKAAQDGALAFRASWQTTGEAVIARGGKQKQKDNRDGR